jgi:hypothetical protein
LQYPFSLRTAETVQQEERIIRQISFMGGKPLFPFLFPLLPNLNKGKMGFCGMNRSFSRAFTIGVILVGIVLLCSFASAQATPVLRCGESQTLAAYAGPYVGLANIQGIVGTATVNGVPNIRTMTNAHLENAATQSAYNFANGGVELGCKLENAPAGVSLNNNGSGTVTTVLRISTPTNAHGEIASFIPASYTIPIRLGVTGGGSIVLHEVVGGGNCNANETKLLRLSKNTNAHAERAINSGESIIWPRSMTPVFGTARIASTPSNKPKDRMSVGCDFFRYSPFNFAICLSVIHAISNFTIR